MARILLGVSGGISAYKAVELTRLAGKAGHSVRVVQTERSLEFVGAATFEGITGAPVLVDEFERDAARGAFPGDPLPDHDPISHLEVVRRADVYVIAPASANTIAKLAHGLADNLLTSAALAATCPVVVAPAMNNAMYENPATQANLATLRSRGCHVMEPGTGALASRGESGVGRLPEPPEILALAESVIGPGYAPKSMDGLRVLVTAGGTREPIDSVRYVGNRSSGRMGVAIAAESAKRGADVTLVAANVGIETPPGVDLVPVTTAAELEEACRTAFPGCDVLVMAAAVADFRPAGAVDDKIKKTGRDSLALELEPTTDVLSALSSIRRPDQTLVGFAAEHGGDSSAHGRLKLERKRVDAVVVNDISDPAIGFESDQNEVTIVTAAGARRVPRGPKTAVAAAIVDVVEELRSRTEAPA
ncbi:MAG TPA: bifunctional phosphopantothenoylcysteine decarboxylase/phosphopantothenate--cysteine ligase CoaBC [Thermoleophilaceae bacterium]|nr:bifunctional phosphopantothenoylcysteine decarboxylase/phosphopantothenate--cysteine ligase CoaBC [Thermoleophilaceae bacterium]